MKTCSKCQIGRELDQFSKMRQSKDGLRPICKPCDRAWRRATAADRAKYAKRYRALHPEFIAGLNAAWMKKNAAVQAEKKKAYQQNNLPAYAARNAKREAAKLHATPSWANGTAIAAIYAEAARLTELTGIRHHVDHIYPLQSKVMCGLHCEANLQILTAAENQSKSNRYWPDMPGLRSAA